MTRITDDLSILVYVAKSTSDEGKVVSGNLHDSICRQD